MSSDAQVHGGEPGSDRDGRRERLRRMFGADDRYDEPQAAVAERVPPALPEPEPVVVGRRDEAAQLGGTGTGAGTATGTQSWPQSDPALGPVDAGASSIGSWARRPRPGPGGPPEPPSPARAERAPLVGSVDELRGSWQQVQVVFVDDPQRAVHEAGVLVERTLQEIRARLADGGPVPSGASSTEELRIVLLRYREVLHRLLAA